MKPKNEVSLPSENQEYLAVAGENEDEGDEEDLAVEDGVVEVSSLVRGQTNPAFYCRISNSYIGGQVLKEIHSSALVEILGGMLENPEDDGLRGGEDQGEDPGYHHHHPGPLPLLPKIERGERITYADVPDNRIFFYIFTFNPNCIWGEGGKGG